MLYAFKKRVEGRNTKIVEWFFLGSPMAAAHFRNGLVHHLFNTCVYVCVYTYIDYAHICTQRRINRMAKTDAQEMERVQSFYFLSMYKSSMFLMAENGGREDEITRWTRRN